MRKRRCPLLKVRPGEEGERGRGGGGEGERGRGERGRGGGGEGERGRGGEGERGRGGEGEREGERGRGGEGERGVWCSLAPICGWYFPFVSKTIFSNSHPTLASIEHPISDWRSCAFRIMLNRLAGRLFKSITSITPPVKSCRASLIRPNPMASYDPQTLEDDRYTGLWLKKQHT